MTTQAIARPTYRYFQTIGNAAAGGQIGFRAPVDLAFGRDGLLYVLNHSYEYVAEGKWVVKCNLAEDYLGTFGGLGEGDGQFTWPNSIAADRDGNVYVTDEWLHRVSIFDPAGKYLGKWGVEGAGDGQWSRPAGIAFDQDNNMLAADSFNHRIQKFTKDGRFLGKWGEFGGGPGQFNTPWGLCLDAQGNLYVADWRNDRVQKFDPAGRFLAQFGGPGDGPASLNRPAGVAVDAQGLVYVTDWRNDRVQVYDPAGRHLCALLGEAGLSKWATDRLASNPENMLDQRRRAKSFEPEKRLYQPTGIEADSAGRIVIADTGRHRLQIYQKTAA